MIRLSFARSRTSVRRVGGGAGIWDQPTYPPPTLESSVEASGSGSW